MPDVLAFSSGNYAVEVSVVSAGRADADHRNVIVSQIFYPGPEAGSAWDLDRPPVVLEAGLGNDSSAWSSVLPEVAKTTQVCAYDRAGMGASSGPAPRPHSNQLMAEELHELLRAAGAPESYVLVGHSMGGANVRYLAAERPAAVAGVVLVDSVSEQQPSRYWALLPEAVFHFDTFRDGLERLRTVSPSLGEPPLVVLARGKSLPPPGVSPAHGRRLEAAWLDRPDVVVAARRRRDRRFGAPPSPDRPATHRRAEER